MKVKKLKTCNNCRFLGHVKRYGSNRFFKFCSKADNSSNPLQDIRSCGHFEEQELTCFDCENYRIRPNQGLTTAYDYCVLDGKSMHEHNIIPCKLFREA